MNEQAIIKQVQEGVAKANHTDNISELIALNLKINGYMMYFSQYESDMLKEKLIAYNERKNFEALFIVKSDKGVTMAEKEATVASKEYREKEIETEVTYNAARSFRSQVNGFCDALTQKIANLRREAELNKFIENK